MEVILYSTNCPKCKVLVSKLDSKNIKYVTISNVDTILAKNIQTVPVLEIDGQLLEFKEAVDWVNGR